MTNHISLPPIEGLEYEFSVQFCGRTLTLISAPKDAPEWAVRGFARQAHLELYRRVCSEVHLAGKDERPASWINNPVPSGVRAIWMLVVSFEFGYPEVHDGKRK